MTQNTPLSDHYIRSLNRNIILIIIIVSVIPLILVSSTIYYQFRASYHVKVHDHLRELVHSHSRNIDYFLQEKLSDIRLLVDSYGRDKLEYAAKSSKIFHRFGPPYPNCSKSFSI
jgi:two-component system NtrC family sensor kinase